MRRVHRIPRRWVPIVPSPFYVPYMRTHTHLEYIIYMYIYVYRYKWVARLLPIVVWSAGHFVSCVRIARPGPQLIYALIGLLASSTGPHARYIARQRCRLNDARPWKQQQNLCRLVSSCAPCDAMEVMTDDYMVAAWELLVWLFLFRHVTFFWSYFVRPIERFLCVLLFSAGFDSRGLYEKITQRWVVLSLKLTLSITDCWK